MQFVAASQICEGMCVAEDVCDSQGRVLIARGQRIGLFHIARMRRFGIHSLFIDPNNGEKPAAPVKSELRKQCEAVFSASGQSSGSEQAQPPKLDAAAVRSAAESLVNSLLRARKSILTLQESSEQTDRLMQHSVNVAALAVALGIGFRLSKSELLDIGSAMLLHDVGLMLLPHTLTRRTNPPTPEEAQHLKQHPILGYEYLLRAQALSPAAASLVLRHHERLDGTGYPQGFKADKLTLSMKIVCVAEAYDSLTSSRFGIPSVLPDAALSWMLAQSESLFQKDIVEALSLRIALYPNGTAVRLTTGECGIVAGTLPNAPRRPVVLIHSDSNGSPLKNPMIVDLTRETGRAVAFTAPTLELLQQARKTGQPVCSIDPTLAGLG